MKGEKLKILGIIDNGGSRKIRIQTPLEKLQEKGLIDVKFIDLKELDNIDLTIFEDVDIVYSTWLLPFNCVDISLWKEKYNLKWINDLDDTIMSEETVQYYQQWANQIVVSDYITCTNPLLGLEISKFTNKIYTLPNYLPINDGGQFNVETKKRGGLLRISLIGSESHWKDFMLFKPILNRLAKNKEIVDNCEFIIAGWKPSAKWNKVVDVFKKKKGIKYRVLEGVGTDEYMKLYNEIDVVCQPLESTIFNKSKSALKVIESSIKGCVFVGDEMYAHKEFPHVLVAKTPLEYENIILGLLKDGEFEKVSKELSSKNLELNNWQGRMDYTMELFNLVHSSRNVKLPDNVNLYSIKYNEEQIVEYTPYFNQTKEKAWRFEWNPIIDIVSKSEKEYVGVFSHKFPHKTGMYKNAVIKSLEQANYQEYDVINFSPKYWKSVTDYLHFSYKQHPKLEELLKKTLRHLGIEYKEDLESSVIFSNFFIMKREHYLDYIENWVKPSLQYMEEEIWDEVNVDAEYKSGLPPELLKQYTNLDFYNYQTFVLERMILFFIDNKKLKTYN